MAFDDTPTTWVPNISEDGTNLIIPLASIEGLTAAEADAANGDIRKIYRGLCAMLLTGWNDQAVGDHPSKMHCQAIDFPTGDGGIRRAYNFAFDIGYDSSSVEIVNE